MLSLSLSEDQFEILEYALRRVRRIELADAATRRSQNARRLRIERARRIGEVVALLDYALPEPDHR